MKSAKPSRREFVHQSLSCGAWIGALATLSPAMARRVFAESQEEIVAEKPWGRIEKINEQMWALVSILDEGDFTTVCNGGIIAGEKGVLAIETFMTPRGAGWLSEWSEKLTGRRPTDVVITHYHNDHSAGIDGYFAEDRSPRVWTTKKTVSLIQDARPDDELPQITQVDSEEGAILDLGDRQVEFTARRGHTDSDITIEVTDPHIIWTGDLMFNRMIPNYADALPLVLNEQVESLQGEADTIYVPGHGPIADAEAYQKYREMLAMVEDAARRAHEAGKSVEEAAAEFELPKPFQDWFIYSNEVMPNAFAAWYRQWNSD